MSREPYILKVRSENRDGKAYFNAVGIMFPSGDDDFVAKFYMLPNTPVFVFKDKDSNCYTPKVRAEALEEKSYWNPVGKMFLSRDGFAMRLHLFPDVTIFAYPMEERYEQEPVS